ncbi:MAG: LON peptidase substrate-binding domain-containing protein [bacterium]|nr:LON peptidase substrate-binding domain-containing protein [bacterium]
MTTTPIIPAVPVFPLDDYFVFPGSVTPLHVFETRYRQLMRDLMDSSGRFVMAPCDPSQARDPQGGGPALPDLGTLVEIVRSEELEDGRWLVILLALARVAMVEVASDRLYRKADAQVLPETEAGAAGPAEAGLREALLAALRRSADGFGFAAADTVEIGRLADLLLHTLPLEAAQRRRAFIELDPEARAGLALEWLTPA